MKISSLVVLVLLTFLIIVNCTGLIFAAESYSATSKNSSNDAIDSLKDENIILEQLNNINLDQLQKEVNSINQRASDLLPRLNIKDLILGFVRGDLDLNWKQIIKSLIKYLGQEVTANMYILGQIIILGVIGAILQVFHGSFSSKTISKTANLLLFLVLATLMLQSFKMAIDLGVRTVDYMVSFMLALLPVLLTLLVSMGALASAAIFHPLTYLIVSTMATVIKKFILPLIFISSILGIVNNISDQFRISRLASLMKEISMGALSLLLMVLIGGLMLQGGAAALSDSLSLRTAKYLTGTFIPVIGGIFSDAVDLIVSCSLVIKNALNIFGVIAIIVIVIYPIIKLIALVFIYKFAGALIQPIGDPRMVEMLNGLGNSLLLVFLIVITVAFMFFITITVIVGTANLTVMMR